MGKPIAIRTCKFVLCSALFEGFEETWEYFVDSDPDFSWVNNNRSLVPIEALLNHLDACGIDVSEDLRARCEEIGKQVYVELEN